MLNAKFSVSRLFTIGLGLIVLTALSSPARGQEQDPAQHKDGYVTDWSSHHIVFSNPGTQQQAQQRGQNDGWVKITNDQRYIMQQHRRNPPGQFGGDGGTGGDQHGRGGQGNFGGGANNHSSLHRDWSMSDGANAGTLTLTVSGSAASGNSTSSVTIDGQVFNASAPTPEVGILTETAAPTSNTLAVGGVTYNFCNSTNCAGTAGYITAGNCGVYTGGSRTTTITDLVGAMGGTGGSSSTWECHSGATLSGLSVTAHSNTGGTYTITLTGSPATYTAPVDGTGDFTFSDTGTGKNAGSDGADSSTTFKYVTSGTPADTYDTAAQLANDLYTAIGDNTTVTALITPSYASGDVVTLANLSTTTAYTVADSSFSVLALSATGTDNLAAILDSTVQPNTFPAKYSSGYSTTTPSCSDYIVYSTGYAGSTTQASVVGYTNLYSSCSGTVPTVEFAYNTSGTAGLSPIISEDGTQMAYMQSSGGSASLVLLKWATTPAANITTTGTVTHGSTSITAVTGITAADVGLQITDTSRTSCIPAGDTIAAYSSGTITLATAAGSTANCGSTASTQNLTVYPETLAVPGVPAVETSGSGYQGCTAPCSYAIPLSGGADDTNSSPFYTYNSTVSDTIFVGDNNGSLHEFTGVFKGQPAEAGGSWPVTVYNEPHGTSETTTNATNPAWLTAPVYDSGTSGLVFVGDGAGYLHSVKPSTEAVLTSSQMECGTYGFVDGPVVDSTAEEVYMFIGYGCSTNNPSYVNEFAAGTSISGNTGQHYPNFSNTTDLGTVQYAGDFDNTYYSSATPTTPSGHLYACVNGILYQLPVTSGAVGSPHSSTVPYDTAVSTADDAATCSPLTEFYNSATTTDYLFLSVQANGNEQGCTGACIYNYTLPTGTTTYTGNPSDSFATAGGTSGIVIDNNGSGSSGYSQVYYSTLANQSCAGNGTTGAGTGTCAVQVSQSGLQ